jgi:hypothetical protein
MEDTDGIDNGNSSVRGSIDGAKCIDFSFSYDGKVSSRCLKASSHVSCGRHSTYERFAESRKTRPASNGTCASVLDSPVSSAALMLAILFSSSGKMT